MGVGMGCRLFGPALVALALLVAGCNATGTPAAPRAALEQSGRPASEFVTLGSGGLRHEPSGTVFPEIYNDIPLAGHSTRLLDAHVGYSGKDRPNLSFFLYLPQEARGLEIARGVASQAVETEFHRNNQGFVELARTGMFQDLTFILENSSMDLMTKRGALPAKWSIIRYRDARLGGKPQIGHLILAGYQGRFLKIRLSYPDWIQDAPSNNEADRKSKHFERLTASMLTAVAIMGKTGTVLE